MTSELSNSFNGMLWKDLFWLSVSLIDKGTSDGIIRDTQPWVWSIDSLLVEFQWRDSRDLQNLPQLIRNDKQSLFISSKSHSFTDGVLDGGRDSSLWQFRQSLKYQLKLRFSSHWQASNIIDYPHVDKLLLLWGYQNIYETLKNSMCYLLLFSPFNTLLAYIACMDGELQGFGDSFQSIYKLVVLLVLTPASKTLQYVLNMIFVL